MERDPLCIMEGCMKIIGAQTDTQVCADTLFNYIKNFLPLQCLVLGYFSREPLGGYILSYTTHKGTTVLHQFNSADEKAKKLYKKNLFFENPQDLFVLSNDDPESYYLKDVPIIQPPYYHIRFSHPHITPGGGTLGFEADKELPADFQSILRGLRLPLHIFVMEQVRYWNLMQTTKEVEAENERLRGQVLVLSNTGIIGSTGGLQKSMAKLAQVAPLDVSVLLLGETGTGKELFAQTLHSLSSYNQGPFIVVNCGAIPASLIDNELFGHEKGAYTGASEQYKGRFERAKGGTLFLDEIGELPLDVQARLLRVLENRTVERLGGYQSISLSFRLIAATHRNLKQMVQDGLFREDLYYRLAVVTIEIPPLRERKQDISALVRFFTEQIAARFQLKTPQVTRDDLIRLSQYHWPGNIRELQHVLEEAVALSNGDTLFFETLPQVSSHQLHEVKLQTFDAMVIEYLQYIVSECHGKIQGPKSASDISGLKPNTLRAKLEKYRIPFGRKKE